MKVKVLSILAGLMLPIKALAHDSVVTHAHPHLAGIDWYSAFNITLVMLGLILICTGIYLNRKGN